jgi:histidinol-phosphatase (PHP family)
MPADYHVHTVLCKHAEGDIAQYVATAKAKGIPEICFTDHAPAPDGYDHKYRMEIGQFPVYAGMVKSVLSPADPAVLFGIEADYYDGCEGFLGEWLPAQNFDMVLGSVHYIGKWGFDSPENRSVWDQVDVGDTWRNYFRLVGGLADTGFYDVVGHLDLPKKFGFRPPEKDIAEMVRPALDCIAAAGMSIEINTAGLRKQVGEIYPSATILALACERQIPITFGSDSHTPGDVGRDFDRAVALAREAGYTQCARYRARRKRLVPL